MHFIDEATITVRSGDGGRGCVSFRREKFVPRGGPSGGDGGDGGSVTLVADRGLNTLYPFRFQRRFAAGRGGHGKGDNRHGKSGASLPVSVPVGTVVVDRDKLEAYHLSLAEVVSAPSAIAVNRPASTAALSATLC